MVDAILHLATYIVCKDDVYPRFRPLRTAWLTLVKLDGDGIQYYDIECHYIYWRVVMQVPFDEHHAVIGRDMPCLQIMS